MKLNFLSSFLLCLTVTITTANAGSITYNSRVELKLGQTVVVHGIRGHACSDPAPSWAAVKGKLPKLSIGTFSDGGLGSRASRACGKEVPARAVQFTAKQKGSKIFEIEGDPIKVTVK